jgi:hypothetical protein
VNDAPPTAPPTGPPTAPRTPPPTAGEARTVLSWQRTAFSVLAVAAALWRLTSARVGAPFLLGLALAAFLVLWVAVFTMSVRGRRERDGRPAAALCAGIVVVGLIEIVAVLVGGHGG